MSFPWAEQYNPKSPFMRWMDERLPLPRLVFNSVGGGYPVPRNLNHFWNFGVLAGVAAHPLRPRLVVGFAAETEDVVANARAKLAAKGVDLVAANRVGVPGSGFESDTNTLVVVGDGFERQLGPATKTALAATLVQLIAGRS